jgi:hypothetical protein
MAWAFLAKVPIQKRGLDRSWIGRDDGAELAAAEQALLA